ncbi:hypothetical protein [Salinisphaera sp.]|uniref:hypothetical protein n=1 Tax=Salinisphaera sp. TaxID=1914330 RepID=UPI002D772461|nr:hypothetical protein [Salinisphaera sp.]HET7312931.1 hypothetical protein [Salinisphaera sp.]
MPAQAEYPLLSALIDCRFGEPETEIADQVRDLVKSIDPSSSDSFISQIDRCIERLESNSRQEIFNESLPHTIFDVYFSIRRIQPARLEDALRGILFSYRNLIVDKCATSTSLSNDDWQTLLDGLVVGIETTVSVTSQSRQVIRAVS